MNLESAQIVLRPRGLSEIMELALLWQAGPARRVFVRLGVVLLLPSLALCVYARWVKGWDWSGVWLLAWMLTTVAQGPFTVACGRLMFDPNTRTRDVLRATVSRGWAFIWGIFVSRCLLMASAITLFTLPFIWPRLANAHEILLLEGSGAWAAIGRGRRLAQRRTGDVIGLGFAMLGSVLLGAVFVHQLGDATVGWLLQLDWSLGELGDGGSFWMLLGAHLAIPWVAAIRYLSYIDTRTRRDGWDLQLRMQAMRRRLESG